MSAARVLTPRPYVYHPDRYDAVTRRSLQIEMENLMRSRIIRALPADIEGAWAIFWNGDAMHLEPLPCFRNDDPNNPLRKAWHEQTISRQQRIMMMVAPPPSSSSSQPNRMMPNNGSSNDNNNKRAHQADAAAAIITNDTGKCGKKRRKKGLSYLSG